MGYLVLIPDFLALLKIRIILRVLGYKTPKVMSLITIGAIDFLVSVWMFLVGYSFVLLVSVITVSYFHDKTPISFTFDELILSWMILFWLTIKILLISGNMFFVVGFASLFWASMVPSIWLWAYIGSSLLTRMLLASTPILRNLVRFLDVSDHPIRSVGIVAGSVMALGSVMMLALLSLI